MSFSLWVFMVGMGIMVLGFLFWGLTTLLDRIDLYTPTGNYHRRMSRLLLLTLILWILVYLTAVVLEPPLGDPDHPYERLFAGWEEAAPGPDPAGNVGESPRAILSPYQADPRYS